jgi:agmatinase
MTHEDIIQRFDPNGPGVQGNLFGLPFSPENAQLVLVPVPWEVTVSYRTGTAGGPEAILQASSQIDTFIREIPDAWKLGVAMLPVSKDIQIESQRQRGLAIKHIAKLEKGEKISAQDPLVVKINEACENLNIFVKSTTQKLLKEGKMVGLVGGDHSTPLGFLRALSEHYNRFGILHIDAHADLRRAYEGFIYSHASIMYNALKIPAVNKLVQVGIRDFCDEETTVVNRSMGRVSVFHDEYLKDQQYRGKSWDALCDQIIQELPPLVYVSFDIDGLDPKLCPNTGTPVPGGFEFHEAIFLIKKLVRAGKTIIGFDLSEVAAGANDWDANVGARILFQLSHWMGVSQRKLIASGNF